MISQTAPDKLGLALAGGGFRASLFHLGVLHRLAELDLLRRVQVLSTVSGGSIIGAVYALRLKRWLEERGPQLSREDYIALVKEVDEILCVGVAKNLRTRLFLNPFTTLHVMLTPHSMGRAMARLYERHIFYDAVQRPAGAPQVRIPWLKRFAEARSVRRQLQLSAFRINIHGLEEGVDRYNAEQERLTRAALENPHSRTEKGSVVTTLMVNATSLNSGGRFFFTTVELGDFYLGSFRIDEIGELTKRRALLLEIKEDDLDRKRAAARGEEARQLALALWQRHGYPRDERQPEEWQALFELGRFPGDLTTCPLGLLRQAKVIAWYLRGDRAVMSGRTPEALWQRLLSILGDIDRELAIMVQNDIPRSSATARLLQEFIVELYLLRSAVNVSARFEQDWQQLTLSDAVGASACFPPVFPAFMLLGIYDDAHVTRLGLTDGGVFDNGGIIALLDEGCTSIIVSDTGGVFVERGKAAAGHIGVTVRLPDILMRALGQFQRLDLRERKRISKALADLDSKLPELPECHVARERLGQIRDSRQLDDLAYFQINSPAPQLPPGYAPPLDSKERVDGRKLAALRTDLDGFGEVEMEALINQGYDSADRFVRGFMLERFKDDAWKEAAPEAPKRLVRGPRAERIIEAGHSRFLRALAVDAPLSWFVTLALVSALFFAALRGVTVPSVWSSVRALVSKGVALLDQTAHAILGPVADGLPWIVQLIPNVIAPWVAQVVSGPLLLSAAGLAIVFALFKSKQPRPQPKRRRAVWLHTAVKWLSSVVWNVLWLAWALPLLIAMGSTLFAGFTWLVFFRPWRSKAKIREGIDTPAQRPRAKVPA
jgi:predicted acylesterase/phospholipase RssA